jgi:Tfp pilus assembly PilM family ATPase
MSVFDFLRETSGPTVAVEVAAHQVSAAGIEYRSGTALVTTHAIEPLPAGALVPSLTGTNVHNRQTVVNVIRRVLERTGRPRRIGLVVPDLVAKVSFVRFEQPPSRAADLDQLVRWQVRKTAPFAVDDAQVSFAPGLKATDGQEFVVTLARRAIVEEYESICAEAGAYAGIVDLATFNVINAVLASAAPVSASGADADWLLVNIAPDYASIAILRGKHLIFFRNRAAAGGAEEEGSLPDLVHQAAMYYEDRLSGGGFTRVFLTGAAGGGPRHAQDAEQFRRILQERLGTAVENVDPRYAAALTDRIAAGPALLDTLAPLVGLLLRGRDAA